MHYMVIRLLYVVLALFSFLMEGEAQSWQHYRDNADTFRVQKNTDSAIKYYSLSKQLISKDSVYTDSYIQILSNLANLFYFNKSQYADAEPFYLDAREVIKKKYGASNDTYAYNGNLLGQIYYLLRQYNRAETFYIEAKEIWEKLHTKKSREYAGSCNALGILYNDSGEFEKAEAQHLEARAIREQLFTKEHGAYAQSCNNLAAIYWNLGKYDKAEPLALEAKEIRGRVKGIPKATYAISCVNLANIYRDMGKFQQAEPLYIEARKVREEAFTKQHDDYALSCTILADLYYFMKQYDKAEPLYLEAKDIRQKIAPNGYYYAQSCSDIAQLYREMGKFDEAEALASEAGKLFEGIGDAAEADIAINKNSLGSLYFITGKYDKAEQFLLQARNLWRKNLGEEHPFYTSNTLSLAKVYWADNKIAKANELYIKAFEAQNAQAARMFSFTSEDEKQLFLDNIAGAEGEYYSFYFDKLSSGNKGQPYSISLLRRNQILSSAKQLHQVINNSGDTAMSKKYDNWIELKKQIATLYSRVDEVPMEHLKDITEKASVLEKELVRNSAAFKNTLQEVVGWKEIQQQLKPSEATIEFIEFNYFDGRRHTDSTYYAALILKKDMAEPISVMLFEKKQLENLLTKTAEGGQSINSFYTRGLKVGKDSSLSQLSYNTIWKPLENDLKGITTIYFAPAGLLHRIAFAALPVDKSTVLSDKYQLVQLSTTAAVADQNSSYVKVNDKIYLFGGIQYVTDTTGVQPNNEKGSVAKRSGFDYLPGTSKEVIGIAKTGRLKKFSPTVVQGLAAKENVVKNLTGKQSPKILHIATHGFFFDDPEKKKPGEPVDSSTGGKVFQQSGNSLFRSGLLFAGANDAWKGKKTTGTDDGILTAYEVSNLYLPNTSLVVLSACETALGDIKGSEGVYGLQRSFKMAGVQHLVMSLWKVPDAETAEFMQLFYKNMFERKSISAAFYAAQNLMRNKYRNEPYKWAAWVLVK